jgi:phosphatidylserine/phosphatidylglycerophosphate/cardiolipin synthase-like enzyme
MEPMVWGAWIILSLFVVYQVAYKTTGSADKAKKWLYGAAAAWIAWTFAVFFAIGAALTQVALIIAATFGWRKHFDRQNERIREEVRKALEGSLSDSIIEVIVKESDEKSIVKAEDHIPEMYKAIRGAKSGVFISSGWASSSVVTASFITEISNVLQSGVNVTLVYGFEGSNDSQGKGPRNLEADEALRSLHERSKEFPGTLRLRLIPKGNHAKVVIKDLEYCIVGSYNFLSNKQNAKHELSVRIDSPEIVKEILRDFELHVADMTAT